MSKIIPNLLLLSGMVLLATTIVGEGAPQCMIFVIGGAIAIAGIEIVRGQRRIATACGALAIVAATIAAGVSQAAHAQNSLMTIALIGAGLLAIGAVGFPEVGEG